MQSSKNNSAFDKFAKKIIFVVLVLSFLVSIPAASFASPSVSRLKSQKEQVLKDLNELNADLDEAVESYNEANWKLQTTKKKIGKLETQIRKTEEEIRIIEERISKRAKTLYMMKEDPIISSIFEADSITDIITGFRMIQEVLATEAELNIEYKTKKRALEKDKKELAELYAQQKKLVEITKAKKAAIEKKVREKERLLSSIDSELKRIIQEEEERQRQLALSLAARNRSNYSGSSGSSRTNYVSSRSNRELNSDTSIGQRAVNIALSLLGRPYRWGASGPGAFDCSGFTMYVYAQLGIGLPHSSAAQYSCGTRVSYDELAPGDLVFFARRGGRISHVGMYIGGGMMVHAPQTGDVVKVVPLSSHSGYVGAIRPY